MLPYSMRYLYVEETFVAVVRFMRFSMRVSTHSNVRAAVTDGVLCVPLEYNRATENQQRRRHYDRCTKNPGFFCLFRSQNLLAIKLGAIPAKLNEQCAR